MASQRFTSPPNPEQFKMEVWSVVSKIPPGKVVTYGQVAALVGALVGIELEDYRVFGARWVGGALAACPSGVPWQRVINAQGKVSLPGKAGQDQRALLEAEGVEFDARGRVNLKLFGWNPQEPEQPRLF